MLIDSHAHLDMPQFDPDRHDVIQRARDAGVDFIIAIGTGSPQGTSIENTLELAERYDFIWAGIGVSPHDARFADERYLEKLEVCAEHPKVVLWGEIGLDYYHDLSPRDVQRDVLRRQLRIARRRRLPVALHCRDAWPDLMCILREEYSGATRGGLLHSFTGTRDQALAGAEFGFLISFSGIVTFQNAVALREAAHLLAPNRILLETDCPYLAPVPYRGKRCEPAFVMDIARTLAQVRGTDLDAFARQTSDNARCLLQIPRVPTLV
jgi:TatD DNase family protein